MEHRHGSSASRRPLPTTSEQSTPESSPPHSPSQACKGDVIFAEIPPSPREFFDYGTTKQLIPDKAPDDATSSAIYISYAVAVLVGVPFLIYNSIPEETLLGNLIVIGSFWDAVLRMSSAAIALICLLTGVYFAPLILAHGKCPESSDDDSWTLRLSRWTGASPEKSAPWARRIRSFLLSPHGMSFVLTLALGIPQNTISSYVIIYPGWAWHPFAWFSYRPYHTTDLASAVEGLCLEQDVHDIRLPRKSWAPSLGFGTVSSDDRQHLPLCLTESQWDLLSAGAISSTNRQDVRSVLKGIRYAQGPKAGLAVAVLARDVMERIQNLRENMDALQPFFSNLSLVIFENDSSDGSREFFKQWAAEEDLGYQVDLMECAEAEDCKLGKKHRDHSSHDFAHSSAVGDMDVYRQRVADYITDPSNELYEDYSHMIVLDIDIAVSLSPFGILHSLGERPENAVASSGRQLFAGSWGFEAVPYDFSAFRPWATPENHRLLSLHESYCALMPAGDRWRNVCDAMDPLIQTEMRRLDRAPASNGDFYRVESAFNGAALYPLDLIRVSGATYDSGEDGQRCEHVGFNLYLKKPMYTNRKWDMHIDPRNPGGPSGWRALNSVHHISRNVFLVSVLVVTITISYFLFVHSIVLLGIFMVYPIFAPLSVQGKSIHRMISSHQRKRRRIFGGTEAQEETLFKAV
ncbi:expressed unknown protein [Seminavis robusta]|uniref:Uncharacterized protein n=1 Tax=Seminavis robusta TaxID=568900 RepID=A0A9N8DGD1_9STRA|nr:expressed unknown protein [Seminavis robusta]|eukprot:Sro132_g062390.1 n/a (689) ;mRNA; f:6112-8178